MPDWVTWDGWFFIFVGYLGGQFMGFAFSCYRESLAHKRFKAMFKNLGEKE
jgi:hypothetical protein